MQPKAARDDGDLIDVHQILAQLSVEELCKTAEQYFAAIEDPEYHIIKPFAEPNEAAVILSHFAGMIVHLQPRRGVRLLDFGAGSCWTSRYFAQLGAEVTACDVSPSALKIGQKLLELQPIVGQRPAIRFKHFDGKTLDFADREFDRIAVMDAFHHVPNQEETLAELYRVLDAPGRIVMVEPGPEHSRSQQSQDEMRRFTVVERDIEVVEIARIARHVGFNEVRVGIYAGIPWLVSADEFDSHLEEGTVAVDASRHFLQNHRLLVFDKEGPSKNDSRNSPLFARLSAKHLGMHRFAVEISNPTTVTWLGTRTNYGTVNLGVHLISPRGEMIVRDFARFPLRADGLPFDAGQTTTIEVELPPDIPTDMVIEFDLVSEGISWFADQGTETIRFRVSDLQ